MQEPLSLRERKKQETRQRLLEAALPLLCGQGFEATSVEEITEAAGVAKGTFFNYFDTKEAILPALAEARLKLLEDSLQPGQNAPDDPVERIKWVFQRLATDPLTQPGLARHLFAALAHRSEERDRRLSHTLTRVVAQQVQEAQEGQLVRQDASPEHVAGLLRSAFFYEMMTWYRKSCEHPPHAVVDRMVDLLLEGLAGSTWRRPKETL